MNASTCSACSTPVAGEKPPPIVLNVGAIDDVPVTMGSGLAIDWPRLAGLPPFQMFLVERRYASPLDIATISGAYSQARVEAFNAMLQRAGDADALYREYEAWHAAKGYWPNETPLGEIKE